VLSHDFFPTFVLFNHSTVMASIKFGSLVTDIAGKIGGQIIQRGRTGGQIRNLSIPVQRRTIYTQARQLPFAITSQLWRTLSVLQINDWNILAAAQTRYNRFGLAYAPTGFQLFTEMNLNLRLVSSVTSVLTAPALVALPDVSDFDFACSTGPVACTLDWTYNSGAAAWQVVPYLVSARPPGSEDQYKTARMSVLFASVSTGTVDISALIPFFVNTGFVSGNIFNGAYRLIHNTTGQGSPLYRISAGIS